MGKFASGRKKNDAPVELNMSPMVDMTFLLLIFFLVTTTFVKESGVEVNRPVASTTVKQGETNMIIGVTKEGMVYIEGQVIDIRSVRSRMERFKHENPEGKVVITADKESLFGVAIEALDQVRLANIKDVVVAATKE
jgi:biopolymer transport protein ExbD